MLLNSHFDEGSKPLLIKPGYASVASMPIRRKITDEERPEYVEEHSIIDLITGQPFTMKFTDQMGSYHEILVTRPMLERIETTAESIDHSVSLEIVIKGFAINQMYGAPLSRTPLVKDANQTFSNIYNGEEIEGGHR